MKAGPWREPFRDDWVRDLVEDGGSSPHEACAVYRTSSGRWHWYVSWYATEPTHSHSGQPDSGTVDTLAEAHAAADRALRLVGWLDPGDLL